MVSEPAPRRRFHPGQELELPNTSLRLRVVAGRKAPGDLRLEWLTPQGWEPVPMAVAALVSDFMVENKEFLRGTPAGAHRRMPAVDYWWGYLRSAVLHGWRHADGLLQGQRPQALPRLCPGCRGHHPVGTTCTGASA